MTDRAEVEAAEAEWAEIQAMLFVPTAIQQRILALHKPERRWQRHPDQEWSYDTAEELLDDDAESEDDLHVFLVCAECGRVETSCEQDEDAGAYCESLWPCATFQAIKGDQ